MTAVGGSAPGVGETGPFSAAGAVLSGEEIEASCAASPKLIDPFREGALKPAAYDVVIAKDGMITPDKRVFPPGVENALPLILEPGDTAFVSTYETFCMPAWLTGTISIKASLARRGVLLLTGLVVDPHYRKEAGDDGRLHFTLANLGGEVVVIEPHHTPVVTIQFVRTSGTPSELPRPKVSIWSDPQKLAELKRGLWFITELRDLRTQLSQTRERLERQSVLTEYALIAGLFLLATTILGVSAASILSAASEHGVVNDVRNAIPRSSGKRVFLIVIALSVAWTVFSVSQALVRGRTAPRAARRRVDQSAEAHDLIQRSALARIRVDRLTGTTLAGVVVLLLATGLVEAAIAIGDVGSWWWAIPIVISIVSLLAAKVVRALWRPVSAVEVKRRVAELYAGLDSPEDST